MRTYPQGMRRLGILFVGLMVLAGCISDAAIQRLSLAEQSELHVYRQRMTAAQTRAYLAKSSAAERTTYLSEIGLVQRFQALDPLDRDAVQHSSPRPGMSAEALRFVWGDPVATDGDARRSAHWHYFGSSFARGTSGNLPSGFGNRVDVYLVDGKVVSWVDVAPSPPDGGGGDSTRR